MYPLSNNIEQNFIMYFLRDIKPQETHGIAHVCNMPLRVVLCKPCDLSLRLKTMGTYKNITIKYN